MDTDPESTDDLVRARSRCSTDARRKLLRSGRYFDGGCLGLGAPSTLVGVEDLPSEDYRAAGAAWGWHAQEWATLVEFGNLPVFLDVLDELDVGNDDCLDVACGSGMALREAARRGAAVAGIDASEQLAAIAIERVPDGDIQVGDMNALPWMADSFDVVTSFNGIWNVESALQEIRRVLRPGGRVALSFWGDPDNVDLWQAWVPAIMEFSHPEEIEASGDLLRIGQPGEAERLLADAGFSPGPRRSTLAQAEFTDVELAARAFCSSGPAWAAATHSGEEQLRARLEELMRPFVSPRTGIVRLVNEWAWITAAG